MERNFETVMIEQCAPAVSYTHLDVYKRQGQDETVGQTVAARAAEDPRIRYQKLEKNEGIAGNTNQGFALATGESVSYTHLLPVPRMGSDPPECR